MTWVFFQMLGGGGIVGNWLFGLERMIPIARSVYGMAVK